jgi:hypothetical protein
LLMSVKRASVSITSKECRATVRNPAMRGVGILLGIPEAKFPCDFSLRCGKQYSDHDRAVGQSSVAVPKVMDYAFAYAFAVAGFTEKVTPCVACP